MEKIEIVQTDLNSVKHANAVIALTDRYARDEMGLNTPLPDQTKETLIDELKKFSGYLGFIVFVDGQPAGIANCIYSFSTFRASKVINIHDLAVNSGFRGNGLGNRLLNAVESKAREENCCKITLEVREDNPARNLYERFGFMYGEPQMFFMEKQL